jgi:hypothetical protein
LFKINLSLLTYSSFNFSFSFLFYIMVLFYTQILICFHRFQFFCFIFRCVSYVAFWCDYLGDLIILHFRTTWLLEQDSPLIQIHNSSVPSSAGTGLHSSDLHTGLTSYIVYYDPPWAIGQDISCFYETRISISFSRKLSLAPWSC